MRRILFEFDPECEKSDTCVPSSHISECYHCMSAEYFNSRQEILDAFKSFRKALAFFAPDFHEEPDLACGFKLDYSHMVKLFEEWLDFSVEFDHLVSAMPDKERFEDE